MRRVIHDSVTVDAFQALLSHDSAFTRTLDFRIRAIEAGSCVLFVPFNPLFERPGGIVAGQVYMTAADVAMWLAIKTLRGLDDASVTVNMTTSFVSSARQEPIVCSARVLKAGGRLSHGAAECVTGSGSLLTHHTLTYMRPDPKPITPAKA